MPGYRIHKLLRAAGGTACLALGLAALPRTSAGAAIPQPLAFAFNAEITLHVTMHYGENLHHIAEAVFKAVGRALAEATRLNPRIADVPSTKGAL